MILGEYPWDSLYVFGGGSLEGALFLFYLFVYSLLVFFILQNFFLAIVVEAFVGVKDEMKEQCTENSFPYDLWDMYASVAMQIVRRYPSRKKVLHWLQEQQD